MSPKPKLSLSAKSPLSSETNSPPVDPVARKLPPANTVLDPMQESAVFNSPVGFDGLQASESHMYCEEQPSFLPLRERPNDNGAMSKSTCQTQSENDPSDTSVEKDANGPVQSPKRQPRKLTKSRGNSDTGAEKLIAEQQVLAEKTRGILVKKSLQRLGSTKSAEQGEAAKITPPLDGNGKE